MSADASRTAWCLAFVFALAALLQIGGAWRQGLWADEIFSLAMATGHSIEHPAASADATLGDYVESREPQTIEEVRRYVEHEQEPVGIARVVRAVYRSDTSPPLYYGGLYFWTLLFGTGDWALRSFSMVCTLACLPFLFAIARRIADQRSALVVTILFSCAPLAVYYSAEGRMYGLLWLCVAAQGWASLRVHDRGGIGSNVAWVLTSAAGLLTHYFFVFPWAATVLFLFLRPHADRRLRLFLRLAVVGALILPWYLHLPESLHQWRVTGNWLEWTPGGFNRIAALRDLVMQFFTGRSPMLWASNRSAEKLALGACALMALIAVWRKRGKVFAGPRLMVWLWFGAACAGPVVFDLWRGTYTHVHSRYAAAALPAACLLAGAATAAASRVSCFLWVAVMITAWSPSLMNIQRNRARSGSPVREAAHFVSQYAREGDLILVHSIPSGVLGIAHYATGPAKMLGWVGQLRQRQVPADIATLAEAHPRIWFVKLHEVGEPAPEEDWLRMTSTVKMEKQLGSIRVIEFESLKSTKSRPATETQYAHLGSHQ